MKTKEKLEYIDRQLNDRLNKRLKIEVLKQSLKTMVLITIV